MIPNSLRTESEEAMSSLEQFTNATPDTAEVKFRL